MTGWLLDTNVVSELRRSSPEPAVRSWIAQQPPSALHLGIVTIAELRYGMARLAPGDPFRAQLVAWLEQDLLPWFEGRVMLVTEGVVECWISLVQRGRAERQPRMQPDLLLAATGLVQGLGVATRNTSDFAWTGVTLVDPWQA